MKIEELFEEYLVAKSITKIIDVDEFKKWLEKRISKNIDRPIFIARGIGGGQTYKILYEVFDIRENGNKPCYFYSINKRAVRELTMNGHKPLQLLVQ